MKHSLGKLRRFAALQRSDAKEKPDFFPPAQLDELAQASKDMQSIKNCYDSLLSAAAATANSAYEFSESLQEMGACLIEKTSLHGDEESGRLLAMLGKVQFELQQLVDTYRSHIFLTITNPSESFLNELRTVEEMKKQCDEKRDAFEYMMAQQKEKGKLKSGKGESRLISQQVQRAREEYDDEANLCVFRLKSLKQGQSRSLLTQAARHHTAQLSFFRRGLKSLEAVDSHVKVVAEQQHIDYQSSVFEDDAEDGEDDVSNGFNVREGGELSFDYRSSAVLEVSTSRNSMEVDDVSFSIPHSTTKNAEASFEKSHMDIPFSSREHRLVSHSAPIFPEKKTDTNEKLRHVQPLSTHEPNSYVLPTPIDAKGAVPRNKPITGPGGSNHNPWHSSPLEQRKHDPKAAPELKEGRNSSSTQLPPPLSESIVSDMEKIKRQAFSGPLTSKPLSKRPVLSTSGPISSPKVSPSASPPLVSSPRISELHELPRPPGNLSFRPGKPIVGHSAPLVSRNQEANKIPSTASPLPAPPLFVPRSYSIPSSSQRAMTLNVAKSQALRNMDDISSPPLTPISLADMKPRTTVAAIVSHSGPMRGGM